MILNKMLKQITSSQILLYYQVIELNKIRNNKTKENVHTFFFLSKICKIRVIATDTV